jgi:hypothetical protein
MAATQSELTCLFLFGQNLPVSCWYCLAHALKEKQDIPSMPDESAYKSINQVPPFPEFSRQTANYMSARAQRYQSRSKVIEPYKHIECQAKYDFSGLR